MLFHILKKSIVFVFLFSLTGCGIGSEQSIINQHAGAILTKNNELQFQFKINEKMFTDEKMYKVRLIIHNEKLASALGSTEIIYGEDFVHNGEYIEVNKDKADLFFMNPIPLKKDLHTFELKKMITNEESISVEVFNDQEVIGRGFLTNFASQL
ncbi:hypothetical protein ACFYKX_23515 [Cytobacillus sp. FJAT-54145]|uniref:Lipoprotein n=1 Tax=Cytobacillus spartinae TaxID=3299023 RepID=A0ABW6KJ02_9BACI